MLTLAQLYKLAENIHVDIFEGLSIPENCSINRTVLIDNIMQLDGLNIPLYADPIVMQSAITLWSARHQYTFTHIGKILDASYSPIEDNEHRLNETTTKNLNDGTTKNSSMSATTGKSTYNTGKDTTTETSDTSAYNASEYQPKDEVITELEHGHTKREDGTAGTTTEDSRLRSMNSTETRSKTESGTSKFSHQQLMEQEFDLMGKFNPYTFIAGLFENELTLTIY